MTATTSGAVDDFAPFDGTRSNPVRTLFLSHDGGMAGAQKMLLTLLEGLDRNVVFPVLVVPFRRELAAAAEAIGIHVDVLPWMHWAPCQGQVSLAGRFRYFAKFLLRFPSRISALREIIVRHKIDLVYSNTVTMLEGAVSAKFNNVPHVWHIHEPIVGNNELSPILPGWLYESIIRALSQSIIFPSKSLLQCYPSLGAKAEVIHNGLALPEVRDRETARRLVLEHMGLPMSARLVGVVGALQPRKDHETFIRMAGCIQSKYNDAIFLIVGVGDRENTERVRRCIQRNDLTHTVLLLGRWQGEIADLMAGLDVLVISSEQESFGLTAIEAMAVETPVVSTKCGGPEEVLEQGVTGYLAPLKDAERMSEFVVTLLRSTELARQMGHQGRQISVNHFTNFKYVYAIESVISRSRPSVNSSTRNAKYS